MAASKEEVNFPLTFTKVIRAIQDIDRLYKSRERMIPNKEEARVKVHELQQRIRQEQGEEAAVCLSKIFQSIGILEGQADDRASPPDSVNVEAYGDYFDISIYRALLPYMKLAYQYEKNGDPQEHAVKLAVLFKNTEEVFKYLFFKRKEISVHDACLFALPDVKGCNFSFWQKLATQNDCLKTKEFKGMLAQACELEAFIKQKNGGGKKKNISQAQAMDVFNKKKEIRKKHAKWKRLKKNQEERDKEAELYLKLSERLIAAKQELLRLCKGYPLVQMDLFILRCYQEAYIQESSNAYKYMLAQGLTRRDFEKFLSLDRSDAGKNIPDVLIDGSKFEHAGYYLRKANVLDEEEAARAACLGKLTNCCQSLSGESGEPCTIHGLTSPNGGFYILCKGNAANPHVSDEVIAQSWVWRSKTKALVFDSIERKESSSVPDYVIVNLYRKLGEIFCNEGYAQNVTCGTASGISSEVGYKELKVWDIEQFSDYQDYTDSREQCMISTNDKPYYLYGKNDEATERTNKYITDVLAQSNSILEEAVFCKMLNVALLYDEALLNQIEQAAEKSPQKEALEEFKSRLLSFIQGKDVDLETIAHSIEAKEFSVYLRRKDGSTILHFAAANPELLKKILETLPENERLDAVNVRDKHGGTVLHKAAKNPESLQQLLALYPENKRLDAVKVQDENGETVLHSAAENPESLQKILGALPEKDRLDAVSVRSKCGGTVLHNAAKNPGSLQMVLALYPENERLEAVKVQDNRGGAVLRDAAKNPELLQKILEALPEKDRLDAVKVQYSTGRTVLHDAAKNPRSLQMALALYPENERLDAVKARDMLGFTVLHNAAANPESLQKILEALPENERLEAVKAQDSTGRTVLYHAAKNPESLQMVLALYPGNERLDAVKEQDKWGNGTVLHNAVQNPESLQQILELYPEDDRLNAVKEQDNYGGTVLYHAATNPESLQKILEALPEKDRRNAAKVRDSHGRVVLHNAAKNSESLQMVLALYPENERRDALKVQDYHGYTVLHHVAKNPKSLQEILELYPENERLEAVKVQDRRGRTVLHRAAKNPKSLQMVFELYPENERLEAVKVQDSWRRTVLHYAVNNPESLQKILEALPEKDRLDAVKVQDSKGRTVLHDAAKKPQMLEKIHQALPQKVLEQAKEELDTLNQVFSKIPQNKMPSDFFGSGRNALEKNEKTSGRLKTVAMLFLWLKTEQDKIGFVEYALGLELFDEVSSQKQLMALKESISGNNFSLGKSGMTP